jgi:hypothetical protein
MSNFQEQEQEQNKEHNQEQNQEEIIKLYLERDIQLSASTQDIVTDALKKLGFYNYDIETELRRYEKSYVLEQITESFDLVRDESINTIITRYRNLDDYKNLQHVCENRQNRSNFLHSNLNAYFENLHTFYCALTIDELAYLGY